MKVQVFSIFDSASEVFNKPFFDVSLGSAERAFGDAINDPRDSNVYHMHPEHFNLYHLGEFDDSNATFNCGVARLIRTGVSMVRG